MMPCLPIPNDLPIPACGRCRSEYLDETTSSALAPHLYAAFLDDLRVRVRLATDILSVYLPSEARTAGRHLPKAICPGYALA